MSGSMVRRSHVWLAERLLATPCAWPLRLVAIDGPAGAGKSHFAGQLASAFAIEVPIVPIDDFIAWDDLSEFWPRFERDVLELLFAGQRARYQRRDWEGDRYGRGLREWKEVPPAPLVIVEGVGASRAALAERLTCGVWIETPGATRVERGVLRDGERERALWLDWQRREEAFFESDGARARAHLVVSGAALSGVTAASDAEFEVIAARAPFT